VLEGSAAVGEAELAVLSGLSGLSGPGLSGLSGLSASSETISSCRRRGPRKICIGAGRRR